MLSLRKFINKPRPDDWAPLAKFYYADEALSDIGKSIVSFLGGLLSETLCRRSAELCLFFAIFGQCDHVHIALQSARVQNLID